MPAHDPRLHRLDEPHIAPLSRLVRDIRALDRGAVPDFDPADGGVHASILFILQRPGPKAVESGFISRDNRDLTARYMGELLAEARIPRAASLLWNVVPGYAPREQAMPAAEIADGSVWLLRVLALMQSPRVVVFVGQKAQMAKPLLTLPGHVTIIDSPHPSPSNLHTNPDDRQVILSAFREAARAAGLEPNGEDRVIRRCPACSTGLRLPAGRLGAVRCPECGTRFVAQT